MKNTVTVNYACAPDNGVFAVKKTECVIMLTTLPQIFGNSGFVKTAWKLRTEREKMKY
jgi:hypothetical protein